MRWLSPRTVTLSGLIALVLTGHILQLSTPHRRRELLSFLLAGISRGAREMDEVSGSGSTYGDSRDADGQ